MDNKGALVQNNLDANILQWKKDLVGHVVYLVCTRQKISTPYINFNGCSKERPNQLAHYHPDQHVICVSERQLRVQSLEELKRTAVHEITHALGFYSHNADFERKNREINIELALYSPSSVISESNISKTTNKLHKRRIRTGINVCSANGCNKKAVNICRYCMKQYCQVHSEALMVSNLAQINMLSQYDGEKHIKLEKDWNKEGGHPCFQYTVEWNRWYDKKKKIMYDAFGAFLGDDRKITAIPKEPLSLFIYTIENSTKEKMNGNDKISRDNKGAEETGKYSPLTKEDLEATREKLGIDVKYVQPVKTVESHDDNDKPKDKNSEKLSNKKKKGMINKLKAVFGIKHK